MCHSLMILLQFSLYTCLSPFSLNTLHCLYLLSSCRFISVVFVSLLFFLALLSIVLSPRIFANFLRCFSLPFIFVLFHLQICFHFASLYSILNLLVAVFHWKLFLRHALSAMFLANYAVLQFVANSSQSH